MIKYKQCDTDVNRDGIIILNDSDLRRDTKDIPFDEIKWTSFNCERDDMKNADLVIYNDKFCNTKILKNRWGSSGKVNE